MTDILCDRATVTVRLPSQWKAEYASDYIEVERILNSGQIEQLNLDLTRVAMLNPATMWLIDQIQWKCVTTRVTFSITATSHVVDLYFAVMAWSAGHSSLTV